MGRADVAIVTPEWDEPFGLVTIEALSCGTPVAAFGRGGVPEVLADTPDHIARPGDANDLARAVRVALRQPRGEARQIAVERFDLTIMIERYLEVFARLAEGGPALAGPCPAVEYPRLAHRTRIARAAGQDPAPQRGRCACDGRVVGTPRPGRDRRAPARPRPGARTPRGSARS